MTNANIRRITFAFAAALLISLGACDSSTSETGGQGAASTGGNTSTGGTTSSTGGTTSSTGTDTNDDDGDGFAEVDGDCNDGNPLIYPGAIEVCDDGVDNNCNGATDASEPDGDGDSFGPCAGDCDDGNPDISPAADEIPGDGIDNDCDGIIDGDYDGDGFTEADGDCDDQDPAIYPGATEHCFDGKDNDCNGYTDGAEPDVDNDGFGPCTGDCVEGDASIGPNQPEIPNDGIDNNCDNLVDEDIDGDGWTVTNGDCNDNDPSVNPSIWEICGDNIDNDCDGVTDSDCLTACELAAAQRSSVGCIYYAADTNPLQASAWAIAVSNIDLAVTANVVVEEKQGNNWVTVPNGTFSVSPLNLQTLNMPHKHANGSLILAGGAFRITSDLPVIAYQFNPINGATSYLSDASLLLPVSSLDTFYITPGWPYGRDIGNTLRPTHIQIAASAATEVRITSSANTLPGAGVPTFTAGVMDTVNLTEGDFVQLTIANENDSFAGTYIESDEPVSVFTSNDCANVPLGAANCCCEHLEENIFGLQTWGKIYVAARAPQRGAEPCVWQVTAQEDNTTVTFNAHASVTGLPGGNTDTLQARETKEYTINGPAQNPGDVYITSDKPILVTQYTVGSQVVTPGGVDGDPSQVQAVPVEQFLDQYVILVPSTWVNDYIVLVRQVGQTVNIDGNPVNSGWVQAGSSNYQVARVSVADGVHVLDGSEPFGVITLGWDQWDSYAYPGGLNQQVINPIN